MPNDIAGLIEDLKKHIAACEFPAAGELVDTAIAELARGQTAFDLKQRKVVLGALRGARQFETLGRMAQALMLAGHDDPASPDFDPMVRRQYAQSLIEAGQLTAAIDTLRTGLALIAAVPEASYANHSFERGEIKGLLGRANKQLYVEASKRQAPPAVAAHHLQASAYWYEDALGARSLADGHWPHANLTAMVARAERDSLKQPGPQVARDLANEAVRALLTQAESKSPANPGDQPWLRASLGEAYVALRDWPNAAKWYAAYASEPSVSAFELFSARRQLVEVWQINPVSPDGDGRLVRILDFALSSKPGGTMQLTKAARAQIEIDDGLVQQTILDSKNPPYLIEWLRNGFKRARSVAGVFDEGRKQAYGTAFLIAGRTLHPSLGDELLALTAAHVVSRHGKLTASETILRFDELDPSQNAFEVESLFVSPPSELDFCVLRLKQPSKELEPSPIRPFEKFPDRIEELGVAGRSCSTIGHPNGRELALSLANSEILDLGYKRPEQRDRVFMRYTTSTEGGNSGGPVYDKDWNVIGLHRAGINHNRLASGIPCLSGRPGMHIANEGVALKTIASEFRSQWISPPVAISVPTELSSKWQQLEAAILSRDTPESTISALFDDMEVADFPTQPGVPNATAEPLDDVAPEATYAADQFWYGGAVALSKAYRLRRNYRYTQAKSRHTDGLTFVSEGDSWFQYPRPGVRDVIDHLGDSYPIHCRAIAGTLFEDMFADTAELMAAIKDYKPNGILLSGGGNDLLGNGRVAAYVLPYREGVAPSELINPILDDKIGLIIGLFKQLIEQASNLRMDPPLNLKFFIHGYDRAMPKRGGPWLNLPLKSERLDYPTLATQKQVVSAIVDRFNDRLSAFAASYPGVVHYIDCRGVIGSVSDDWFDELHPRTPGFGRVAAEFNRVIRHAFKDHPSIRRDLRNLGRGAA